MLTTTFTKLSFHKTSKLPNTLDTTIGTRIDQLLRLTQPLFSCSIEYNTLLDNVSFTIRTILIVHILRLISPLNMFLANKAIWHSAIIDASMSNNAISKRWWSKLSNIDSSQHSSCVTFRKIASVSKLITLSKKWDAVSHTNIIDKTIQDYT